MIEPLAWFQLRLPSFVHSCLADLKDSSSSCFPKSAAIPWVNHLYAGTPLRARCSSRNRDKAFWLPLVPRETRPNAKLTKIMGCLSFHSTDHFDVVPELSENYPTSSGSANKNNATESLEDLPQMIRSPEVVGSTPFSF